MKRCVIFGAAPTFDEDDLRRYLREGDLYIAADGGLALAHRLGVMPHLVVADHDSSAPAEGIECIHLPIEKDVTDTRVAMDIAFAKGYREFLLLGCTGGRMDHTMANLLSMRQMTEQGCTVRLVDNQNSATVLLPGKHSLNNDFFTGFSVFSMSECVKDLRLDGVKYPLIGYTLLSDDPLCVSNSVTAPDATLSFESGVLLLIFSKD